MIETVIRAYLPEIEHFSLLPIGSGLIHRTWKVEVGVDGGVADGGVVDGGEAYILQQVNTGVFKDPEVIGGNLDKIGRYLQVHCPDYLFVGPMRTVAGGVDRAVGEGVDRAAGGVVFYRDEDGVCYRLFPYVQGSRTFDVVAGPEQAYEAARQFGHFTRHLAGFDVGELRAALPDFHNLRLRFDQFGKAVRDGNAERIRGSAELIGFLEGQRDLVGVYESLLVSPAFSLRVTHHDTKISNVLFDRRGKGLCVIDLDTVMPGYFISDVGDMIRTYVSPASEEETDLDKVVVRDDFYTAIFEGYMGVMGDVLSAVEREHFFYSGLFMVYMQALRFLTDHLNNDVYYGARYEGHNFNRAANQVALLRRLLEKGGGARG